MGLVLIPARAGCCNGANKSKEMQYVKGTGVLGASARWLSYIAVSCVLRRTSTTGVREEPGAFGWPKAANYRGAGPILTDLHSTSFSYSECRSDTTQPESRARRQQRLLDRPS